jgi:hypothetical protein
MLKINSFDSSVVIFLIGNMNKMLVMDDVFDLFNSTIIEVLSK